MLAKIGNDEELVKTCSDALKVDPGNRKFHLARIKALARRGRHKKVVEACHEALIAHPGNLDVLRHKAEAHFQRGEYTEVLNTCGGGLDLHPNDPGLLRCVAGAFFQRKNYEKVLKACGDGLSGDPHNLDLLRYQVGALFQRGEYTETLKTCGDGLKVHPRDLVLTHHKVDALYQLKEYDEMVKAARQAAKDHPQEQSFRDDEAIALERIERRENRKKKQDQVSVGLTSVTEQTTSTNREHRWVHDRITQQQTYPDFRKLPNKLREKSKQVEQLKQLKKEKKLEAGKDFYFILNTRNNERYQLPIHGARADSNQFAYIRPEGDLCFTDRPADFSRKDDESWFLVARPTASPNDAVLVLDTNQEEEQLPLLDDKDKQEKLRKLKEAEKVRGCGEYQLEIKEYKQAAEEFLESLKLLDPIPYRPALFGLGRALLHLGDYSRAEQCFRHVIALKPETAAAYILLEKALLKQRKYEDVLEACEQAEKHARKDDPAYSAAVHAELVSQDQDDEEHYGGFLDTRSFGWTATNTYNKYKALSRLDRDDEAEVLYKEISRAAIGKMTRPMIEETLSRLGYSFEKSSSQKEEDPTFALKNIYNDDNEEEILDQEIQLADYDYENLLMYQSDQNAESPTIEEEESDGENLSETEELNNQSRKKNKGKKVIFDN